MVDQIHSINAVFGMLQQRAVDGVVNGLRMDDACAKSGYSRDTVMSALQVLIGNGAISVVQKPHGRPGSYQIVNPGLVTVRPKAVGRPEHVDLRQGVRELWPQKYSTAEIGRRLGVTKNAVCGVAHRMGLPPRGSPINRSGDPTEPRVPTVHRAPRQTLPALASVTEPTPPPEPIVRPPVWHPPIVNFARPIVPARFDAIPRPAVVPRVEKPLGNGKCCWPMWGNQERPTNIFCDSATPLGDSWCPTHRRVVFVRVRDRREDVAA